jgi:putative membrane protein
VLGKLAAKQASSRNVKDFGQTLATDHGKAKDEAVSIAQQLNVEPPDGLKDEAKEEMDKLKGMSGHAFDREFVSLMVKDHKKDISDYQDQADSANKPATWPRSSCRR